MKFILKIELGSEAMQTPVDVCAALTHIAGEGSTLENLVEFGDEDGGNVWDDNGNTVGEWKVSE